MEKTKVILYGTLAEKYGKEFEFFNTDTVRECVDALSANFKHFRADVMKNKQYHVYVDDYNIGDDELELVITTKTVKIVPILAGASGSLGKIVLGAALIGLAFATGGASIVAGSLSLTAGSFGAAAFKIGVGLLLSGFADLIFRPPDDNPDEEQSYLFNGAVNISKEGSPVPIGYGRVLIGSTNISNYITSMVPPDVWSEVPYYVSNTEDGSVDILTYWQKSDKLYSTEYAQILDLLCEGEVEGVVGGSEGVFLDDISILNTEGGTNIEDVDVFFRKGLEKQTYIPGFEAASSTVTGPNTELKDGKEQFVAITSPLPDIVQVTLGFDGMLDTNLTNGENHSHRTYFQAEYSTSEHPNTWKFFNKTTKSAMTDGEYDESTPVKTSTTLFTHSNQQHTTVTNEGVVLRTTWSRPSYWFQTFDNDGNITYIRRYVGSWIQYSVWYKKKSDSNWTLHTKDKTVNNSDASVGTISDLVDIKLPVNDTYEYRAQLTAASVESYNGIDTKISIRPIYEYLVVSDSKTEVKGKALGPFKRDFSYKIPQKDSLGNLLAFVNIRITRVDEDDDVYNERRDGESSHLTKFRWANTTEIIQNVFTYPHSALVGMTFDAEAYDSIPKRSYLTDLLKISVPSNYDPKTRLYTGMWNGKFKGSKEWCNNPAWAFYDLVINNRFGLGQYIKEENINIWTLYEIAKYCDEEVDDHFGGKEPRYTINTYITKQEEAFVLLRHMASIFRGMIYWMDNKITATYDHDADSVVMYTNSNVIDGTFTYTGSAKDTRYNSVYVSWSDPSQKYKNSIQLVEDTEEIIKRGEVLSTDLTALGCASRGQAFRAGRALLKTERETVVFSASLDNVGGKPGDIAEIYDRYRANVKYSGRVLGIVDNVVQLDGPSLNRLLSDREYTIRLISSSPQEKTLEDGTVETSMLPIIHEYTFPANNYHPTDHTISVNGRNADGNLVKETTDIPPNTVWAINEIDLQPQYFRLVSIEEKEADEFEINAISFNKSKQDWIDFNEPMDYPKYRISRFGNLTPDLVKVNETVKSFGTSIANVISISWGMEPNAEIKEFSVEYKIGVVKDGGEWTYLGKVNDRSYIELDPNTEPGYYAARVSPILYSGAVLPPVESESLPMLGKTYPPKDVTNFGGDIIKPAGFLRLHWDKSPELDFNHYEIQNGPVGFIWDMSQVTTYNNITNTHFDIFSDFEPEFQIKVVDNSGNKSKLPTKFEIQHVPPSILSVNGLFIPYGYELNWTVNRETYPIQYTEIREGPTYLPTSSPIVRSYNTLFDTSKLDQWSDSVMPGNTHTYWLTPVDDHDNKGSEFRFDTTVHLSKLANVAITAEYLRNYIYFNRIDNNEFPVSYVLFEVFDNDIPATPILKHTAKIYGEYYSYRAPKSGAYKFELTPYTIADRKGETYTELLSLDDGGIIYPIDTALRMDGTIPNTLVYDVGAHNITGPVGDKTETWEQHFKTAHPGVFSANPTIDEQIKHVPSYPYYLIPIDTATYSEEYAATSRTLTQTRIEVRHTGTGLGTLTLKVYQKDGTGSYKEITNIVNGKYLTDLAFTHIKVDYIFNSGDSNTYTLESALIIGETS